MIPAALEARVVQCESEIRESFAELFEVLRDNGYITRNVQLKLNVSEIRRPKSELTWSIFFDLQLGTEKVK